VGDKSCGVSVPIEASLGYLIVVADGPGFVPVDKLFLDGLAVGVIADFALTLVAIEIGGVSVARAGYWLSLLIYTSIAHIQTDCKGKVYMVIVRFGACGTRGEGKAGNQKAPRKTRC
jgi:hypothetical protein